MRTYHPWVLIVYAAALAALLFLRPWYGWTLRAWLAPLSTRDTDSAGLAAANEALKAELAQVAKVAAELPQASPHYLRAMVYSRYPFNFKNELLLNVGSSEGVVTGHAVTFQGILIGRVSRVFADTALVQTVFDSDFKLPVRIGAGGYDALIVGGAYPKAESIVKSAALHAGDVIYSAAPGLPYGLPVAEVVSTSTSPDNLFIQADLSFAYDLNTVQTVLIAQ